MAAGKEQVFFVGRLTVAKMIACVCLSILVSRLWYLQVAYGAYFRDLSENNRTRAIRTAAPRGNMYDREGRLLVRNRPAFNIALMLEDTPNVTETIKKLAAITGRDEVKLLAQFEIRRKGSRPFEPKVVIYDVTRAELARVKVQTHKLPGVIVTETPTRDYTNNTLAAQVFGYSREISKSQLEALKDEGYRQGDIIGQSGLEKQFEDELHGKAGYVQVEVDARGTRRSELGIVDAKQGSDLYLSLDIDLQRVAEEQLGNRRGAVVALDPRNGEVLVLASGPSFDANIFTGQMLASEWGQVANDRDRPLTNRAIASAYPPGSTSKIIWAIAGLAEKKITPTTELNCSGYVVLNNRAYHCHKAGGHGALNVEKAIMVSCNVFFYQLGQMLGLSKMTKYLEMFGYGRPTGIDLPGEEAGTAPSEKWKLKQFGERWYPGDSVPISIGQGYFIATPLQMATMIATVANGGSRYRPLLVRKIQNTLIGQTRMFEPVSEKLPVSSDIFAKVREYAVNVVGNARGTGGKARIEGVAIGGKTGTAQVSVLGREGDKFKDHAWFIAFAPAEAPTIAMAVVVENTGHGGTFAAPIARAVMEKHFRKTGVIPEEIPEGSGVQEVKEEGEVLPPPPAVVGQAVQSKPNT